jgi:hypothetical protein
VTHTKACGLVGRHRTAVGTARSVLHTGALQQYLVNCLCLLPM